MKVLVVRAAEDARRTAARLAATGHPAIVAPVLVIRALDFAAPDGGFDAVVATSAHAFGQPARLSPFRTAKLLVVGGRTAEAARSAGFVAASAVAANAVELAVAASRALPRGARLLYFAGRDRKPDLEAAFAPPFALAVVETYAAEAANTLPAAAAEALRAGGAAVLHYSQRSAAVFLDLAQRAGLAGKLRGLAHIAISRDAAEPLIAAGLEVAVAAQPNEDSMFEQLARIETARSRAGDA